RSKDRSPSPSGGRNGGAASRRSPSAPKSRDRHPSHWKLDGSGSARCYSRRTPRVQRGESQEERPMRMSRMLALGASVLLLAGACTTGGGGKPTLKVGSDGFYEAKLMAEIYAQALEAKGYTIDRTGIGIGARAVSAPALESGQ